MSGYRIAPNIHIHPDDESILEAAEIFLNKVLKSIPRDPNLILRGMVVAEEGAKARIREVCFHWVDGDREVAVFLGVVPSLFHQLMEDDPKVSGLYRNYLNKARAISLSTPRLLTVLEAIDELLSSLNYPAAQIAAGHGNTEIPIALYTDPSYLLSYATVVEMKLGSLGTPGGITIH